MYLIDEHKLSSASWRTGQTEFVFGVDEYQPLLCGDFLPTRKKRERCLFHFFKKLFRNKPFGYHLLERERPVVRFFFSRRIKYRLGKLLGFFYTVGQSHVAQRAGAT